MTDELTRSWLDRASADLEVGKLVLEKGFTAHACFQAHQAFGKVLKAYLLRCRGGQPPTQKHGNRGRESSGAWSRDTGRQSLPATSGSALQFGRILEQSPVFVVLVFRSVHRADQSGAAH